MGYVLSDWLMETAWHQLYHHFCTFALLLVHAKGVDKSQDAQHVLTGNSTGCSLPTSPLPYQWHANSSQGTQDEVTCSTTSS